MEAGECSRMALVAWTLTGLIVLLAGIATFAVWQLAQCQKQLPPNRPPTMSERPESGFPDLLSGES